MIFGITFNFNILPLRTPSAGAFCVEWLQGGFTIQPCRGAVGVWCGTRTRIVIFEWASVAALWQGFGEGRAFVPHRCRSASSWTGNGRLGKPCRYRQLREETGSECCHVPFWGTREPCRFSTREVRMDVYDWQGCINRLQNSSFFCRA